MFVWLGYNNKVNPKINKGDMEERKVEKMEKTAN